ncbi:hypothetical protein [Kibdelosporangium aridum]|uniref:hypothetical protein n=1 Tax=Kibdelosporangium aridum TaxID=2030 RepID=UPI0035EA3966
MREQTEKVISWLRRSWPLLVACGLGTSLVVYLGLIPWLPLTIAVAIIVGVVIVVRIFAPLRDLTPKSRSFETAPQPMDIVDLGRAEDYIDTHYDVAAIDYFIKVFTQLPDHLSRVDEDVHMTGRVARSTTHLIFRGVRDVDETPQGILLAPIAWARKGKLFADFRPFNHCDVLMPTLTHWQVNGLVTVAVRTLFEGAIRDAYARAKRGKPPELSIDERLVLLQMVQTATDPVPGVDRSAREQDLTRLVNSLDDKFSTEGKKVIWEFCESLIDIYVIVAEVGQPSGDNLMVGYSNTIVPELSGKETKLRAKHGLLPTSLDVSNPLVFQANSYHFEAFPGHGDMYVYDQRIEQLDSDRPVQLDKVSGQHQQWFIRKDQQQGSPAAHLYVRRQGSGTVPGHPRQLNGSRSTAGDVKSVIEFREVPPGGLGNAVTVSFVTAMIVTFFAVSGIGIDGSSGNIRHDITALMLTLPAFLAAAVGRGMTAERVLSTSLTAFRGLWVVAATSLIAVLLYIYSANRGIPVEVPIFPNYKLNVVWLLLALFSIGTLLYLRRRKNEERRHYLRVRTGK